MQTAKPCTRQKPLPLHVLCPAVLLSLPSTCAARLALRVEVSIGVNMKDSMCLSCPGQLLIGPNYMDHPAMALSMLSLDYSPGSCGGEAGRGVSGAAGVGTLTAGSDSSHSNGSF